MSRITESSLAGFSSQKEAVLQPDDSASNISLPVSRRSSSSTASFKRQESRVKLKLARLVRTQEVERLRDEAERKRKEREAEAKRKRKEREAEAERQREEREAEAERQREEREATLREADRRLAMAELEAEAWEEESERGSCYMVLDETGSDSVKYDSRHRSLSASKSITCTHHEDPLPFVKSSPNFDDCKPSDSNFSRHSKLPDVFRSSANKYAANTPDRSLLQPPPGFPKPILRQAVNFNGKDSMAYIPNFPEADCSHGSSRQLPEDEDRWGKSFTPGSFTGPRNVKGPEAIYNPVVQHKSAHVPEGNLAESMRVVAETIRDGFDAPKRTTPTFSGDPLRFFEFVKAFEDIVTRQVPDSARQLGFLLDCCIGEPHDLILPCASMEGVEGISKAKELLFQRYGQRHILVDANLVKLMGPEVKPDGRSLQDLANDMLSCQLTLTAWNYGSSLNSRELILSVLKRLPKHIQREFHGTARKRMAKNQEVTFEDLTAFVQEKASMACDFIGKCIADTTKISRHPTAAKNHQWRPRKQSSVFSTQAEQNNMRSEPVGAATKSGPSMNCSDCNGRHPLWKCDAFRRKTVMGRWKIARDRTKRVCFKCLAVGHMSKECTFKGTCHRCGGHHHSLLHKDRRAESDENNPPLEDGQQETSEGTSAAIQSVGTRVRLKVVPVKVWALDSATAVDVYAFLDEGSDMSFCTNRLNEKLGIRGTTMKRRLSCMIGSEIQVGQEVSLSLRGVNENKTIRISSVMAVPDLPKLRHSFPSNMDVARYTYLRGLDFAEIEATGIDLLIGAGVQEAHAISGVRQGGEGQPRAVHTGLGWALVGPEKVDEGILSTGNCVNFVKSDDHKELHVQMQELFNRDFIEDQYSDSVAFSLEDKRALQLMTSTIEKKDGHYYVGLPWKKENVKLPFNRKLAEKRLVGLKRRLLSDRNLLSQYKQKMEETLSNGYAQRLTEAHKSDAERIWYIPHHCTGPKFRIVFDCAAKFGGTSLNENLLQGPDQTSTLLGVLCRFRQQPIAFVADIKAMFCQVRVTPTDTDSLRFLWWPEGDLDRPPEEYKMLVHLFGATSSPSCASFALKKVAEENRTNAGEEALSTVAHNFYVDDCLKSVATVKEAIDLIKELGELLKDGGFHLTKFMSNRKNVLSSVEETDRAATVTDLDLVNSLPVEKTLGVLWNADSDNFEIKVNVRTKSPTRRGILSMTSQLFDPLGFVQPCILPVKKLLQQTCKDGLGWDEVIPDQLKAIWDEWLSCLSCLKTLKIPRCFKQHADVTDVELHCFSDASELGYGAVCYFRYEYRGRWKTSFVLGKSRVSPSKPVTIPRLELAAAVVAVKLARIIQLETEYDIKKVVYWTDSTSVIQYISNTAKRFKTYVANRLAIIQEHSQLSQWRHVGSKENPADLASRGVMPSQADALKFWLDGPEFLRQSQENWPVRPTVLLPLTDEDVEIKKTAVVCTTQETSSCIDRLLDRYSDLFLLQRAVVWLRRLKSYFVCKYSKRDIQFSEVVRGNISPEEIECATMDIVRIVQKQAFPALVNQLASAVRDDNAEFSTQAEISMGSHVTVEPGAKQLRKLSPFLVRGILRVGGRLQRSALPFDIKHQILLPTRHNFTDLVIRHYHSKVGHGGTLHVLSTMRERFWVLKGHSAVKRVLNGCMQCRRWKAKIGEQIMAPLPACRVTTGGHPFKAVGLDYMGPIFIKQNRNRIKRYGCIFTCMATRAVHIEVAHALDTSSFLNAFRRFACRRGYPDDVYSDNGTNFVGAERELREGIQRLNLGLIDKDLLRVGVRWHFNPPAASHQGGIWERVIRTVRKILQQLTCDRVMTDEQLLTFMVEVERILNDRPLTPVSDDPEDLNPLTPSSILLGRIDVAYPPDQFIKADGYKASWRAVQFLIDQFWKRWLKEYLPLLQQRQKWLKPVRNISVGDVVLIIDESCRRGFWPKGIIVEVFPDRDGFVRRARVRTATTIVDRDIRKLCLLEGA